MKYVCLVCKIIIFLKKILVYFFLIIPVSKIYIITLFKYKQKSFFHSLRSNFRVIEDVIKKAKHKHY